MRLQLGQIRVASTAIHHHLLHSHRLHSRPDQVQNPNSKRAVWILEFGFWSLEFGVWSLDFGFWILDLGFWILDFGFWILDFGFWILDFGFWSLDFGFWILDQFSIRSFCGGPKRRRLDFGVWILDFGFWILVWMRPYSTSFGSCIRYFHVTPTRVGGFHFCTYTPTSPTLEYMYCSFNSLRFSFIYQKCYSFTTFKKPGTPTRKETGG